MTAVMTRGEVLAVIAPLLDVDPEAIGSYIIVGTTGHPLSDDAGFVIAADNAETSVLINRLCDLVKYLANPRWRRRHPTRGDGQALFTVCGECGREIEQAPGT
jgi:hypothetical protein